jgi:predicted DCC family thiol-disulfide oxidoreductase YuxK
VRDAAPPAEPGLTVWYDGACPLCAREIALMRRLDEAGEVNFVDLEATVDTPLPRQAMLQRFHVTAADGSTLSGAAAFVALWRQLPATRLLGRAASWPPLLALLERAYDLFLRLRPRLQALVRRWEARRQEPRR